MSFPYTTVYREETVLLTVKREWALRGLTDFTEKPPARGVLEWGHWCCAGSGVATEKPPSQGVLEWGHWCSAGSGVATHVFRQ